MSPQQICTEIKLCTSLLATKNVEGGAECALCEFVMKELDQVLSNNATDAEIEKALEQVCSILPSSLQSECQELVQQYTPEIIQLITSGMSPQQICTEIKLCTSLLAAQSPEIGKCALCEFVMKELDSLIGNNATQEDIEEALEQVCGLLPGLLTGECKSLIKEYGPSILKALLDHLDPKQICSEIKLCSGVGAYVPTEHFDAREKWSHCKSIGSIKNQGHCGSCWAFGAVETLEDRFCIKSEGHIMPTLSEEYLVDCDGHDDGCGGGFLDNAWHFLQDTGVPEAACDPYKYCAYPPFPNCTKPGFLSGPEPPAPSCPAKCADGRAMKRFRAKSAYAVAKPGDVAAMQHEIEMNGPIEVAFFVFSDFMHYQSGVYVKSKTAQGPLGGHAVKILGWGTEAGVPYWLVANSWSPNWGDHGFFKIRRGTNECGIETTPAAGEPLIG